MAIIPTNNISKIYKNEYLVWREDKNFQEAKRQEYLRQNPDFISDYDLQRAKILLYAVDMMDRSVSVNSDHINTIVEGTASVGLGYSAISGAATGHLIQKTKFVQKHIDKFVQKIPKSKNLISMAITTISGVLGVVTSYPIYAFFSNLQSKVDRKKRFDTMEKELKDPKIFSTLTPEQRVEFEKNLANLEKFDKSKTPKVVIEKSVKSIKKTVHEVLNYDKEQTKFRQKYEEDKSYYDKDLTEQEIRNAKKDKVLLCILTREINTKSQSYAEKMQRITDNVITFSFAFGSLLSLGYERIARNLKWNKSSLPAGMGILLMLTSTFFATWAQSRASHIGRFKAKQ